MDEFKLLTGGGTAESEWSKAGVLLGIFAQPAIEQFKLFTAVASILLGWVSVSVEMFIRHSFGERYISAIRMLFALGMLWGFSVLTGSVLTNGLMNIVAWAMVGLYLFHRWGIRRRNQRGIEWHSFTFGISWLELLQGITPKPLAFILDDWNTYRFTEPILAVALGMWFRSGIDPAVGLWLIVGGIALFLKNQLIYAEQYNRVLDIRDARIEQQHQSEALDGKPKQEAAGLSVAPAFRRMLAEEDITPNIAATVQRTMK